MDKIILSWQFEMNDGTLQCLQLPGDKGDTVSNTAAYVSLLEQREEENRVEVTRLTEEIRALKLQLLQLTSPENGKHSL